MTENLLPFERIKREVIIKKQSETSDKYGCRPEDRKTEEIIDYGVVNVDKPSGPTSHQTSDFVKKILHLNKAGHSGTLDPGVTGVLPIAFGRGTRVVQALLKAGKEYITLMHLHREFEEEELRKTIGGFVGKIRQLPPVKSAVKRQMRDRQIYYIDVMEIDGKDVLFKVGCEAGTYIRKLCHDIGEKLGWGANMLELRRTKAGPFTEENLYTLQDLQDAFYYYKEEKNDKYLRKIIQPVEFAVSHLPKIWVFDTTVTSLCHGQYLKLPGISKFNSGIKKDDIVAVMTLKDELVGLGISRMPSEEIAKAEKGVSVNIDKVFMKEGLYSNKP